MSNALLKIKNVMWPSHTKNVSVWECWLCLESVNYWKHLVWCSGNAAQQLHTVMIKWCKCVVVLRTWHKMNVTTILGTGQSMTLRCYWVVNLTCVQAAVYRERKWSRNAFSTPQSDYFSRLLLPDCGFHIKTFCEPKHRFICRGKFYRGNVKHWPWQANT